MSRTEVIVIIAGALLIGALTLGPPPKEGFQAVYSWFDWMLSAWWAFAIFNTVMFIPLGIGIGMLAIRRELIPVLVATPIFIETVQVALPGRGFQVIDVLTNSFGALIGYAIGKRLAYHRRAGLHRP